MIAHVLGVGDVPTEHLDLSPQHEYDFCDQCGDCLYCYREDHCGGVDGRMHAWVVYPEDVTEFKIRFGVGVDTP